MKQGGMIPSKLITSVGVTITGHVGTFPVEGLGHIVVVLDDWIIRHLQKGGAWVHQIQGGLWDQERYILYFENVVLGPEWDTAFRIQLTKNDIKSIVPPSNLILGWEFPENGVKFYIGHKEQWEREGYDVSGFKEA